MRVRQVFLALVLVLCWACGSGREASSKICLRVHNYNWLRRLKQMLRAMPMVATEVNGGSTVKTEENHNKGGANADNRRGENGGKVRDCTPTLSKSERASGRKGDQEAHKSSSQRPDRAKAPPVVGSGGNPDVSANRHTAGQLGGECDLPEKKAEPLPAESAARNTESTAPKTSAANVPPKKDAAAGAMIAAVSAAPLLLGAIAHILIW
ncbi:hypothetical protein DQ04_17811000 [Trypanosoma grayi]|uniref:hypothetical protein n=1 Tax=Trypanosoma grayi TaxID=71804 RepID=UPI0004F426C9|nr:hypothetical protein DQ04_17811000 [Trypanosoma grayi]KEG05859.1 hypothetical protein DQ04_17811000 [Trypanosoma grayi]